MSSIPLHPSRSAPFLPAASGGRLNITKEVDDHLLSGGGREQNNRARGRDGKKRSSSFAVEGDLRAQLEWLQESEGGGDSTSQVGPPCLYIDGRTVLEEIRDIRCLRRGDHCCVGLNVLRRLHWIFDWLTFTAARWECLKLYHHFVMMDDVVALVPAEDVAAVRDTDSDAISHGTSVLPGESNQSQASTTQQEEQEQEVVSSTSRLPLPRRVSSPQAVAAPRVPVRSDGQPARICEYGTTIEETLRMIFRHGLFKHGLWRMIAPFQALALRDYVENSGTAGIFRVKPVGPPLTDAERDAIVREAENLCHHYQPYDLFWRNCESAAFSLSPRTRRWVSPEVPNTWWNIFRGAIAGIGAFLLSRAKSSGTTAATAAAAAAAGAMSGAIGGESLAAAGVTEKVCGAIPMALASSSSSSSAAPWFHLLVTVPAGLQVLIELVRSTIHLTEQRHGLGGLGDRTYHHLLTKEVGRCAFVGGSVVAVLGHVPAWVALDPDRMQLAAFVCVFAYPLANAIYGLLARGAIEVFKRICGGVPVFTFFYGSSSCRNTPVGSPPGGSSPGGSGASTPPSALSASEGEDEPGLQRDGPRRRGNNSTTGGDAGGSSSSSRCRCSSCSSSSSSSSSRSGESARLRDKATNKTPQHCLLGPQYRSHRRSSSLPSLLRAKTPPPLSSSLESCASIAELDMGH